MLSSKTRVLDMIGQSFLNEETKIRYKEAYLDKLSRLGMTKGMIGWVMDPEHPAVYTVTDKPAKLTFRDESIMVGSFVHTINADRLAKENR